VSATSVAAVLSQQAASGAVPDALLSNTIKATTILAAGQTVTAGLLSAEASPLTEGVLQAMALAKLKTASVCLVVSALVLVGGAIGYHILPGQRAKPEAPPEVREGGIAEADVARYGSAAGAKECAKNRVDAIQRSAGIVSPVVFLAPFEAQFDRETHQWIVTTDLRADIRGPQPLMLEKQWKWVISYDASRRSYDVVSEKAGFDEEIKSRRFDAERGWRPARMDNLSKWVQHKFQKPKRSATPVTSLHIVWPSDRAARFGHPKSYTGNKVTADLYANPGSYPVVLNGRGVIAHVDGNAERPFSGKCTLRFGAAYGCSLRVGGYGGVGRADHYDRLTSPYFELLLGITDPPGPREMDQFAEFVVWECEVRDHKIIRLAIDYIGRSSRGSLRYKSLFQPAIPVP
jgi:hypothetical protein